MLLFRLTVLAGVLCLAFAAWAGVVPPKKFRLLIAVTDSVSKAPLEAASVYIPELHKTMVTGETGLLVVDSLPKGLYTIQSGLIGYHPYQVTIWLDEPKMVSIPLCPESKHLHEVEVTTHLDELHDFTVQSRAVLDQKMIERNAGINLAEQLKRFAGVQLLSSGPTISKPVVRGLHSNRLVTINNGIRQEGQQWGADHGTEIDPFTPARLEVIKGAASVEYGAEAIGGVVRITPRAFKDTKGISGEAQLMGASNNGLGVTSLLLEGSHFNQHKLSWRTRGTLRKAGDSRTPDYVLSNTGFKEMDGSYALHYAYKKWHVEWMQSYFSTELGILRASHVGNTTDLMVAIANGKPAYVGAFTYAIDRPKQEVSHLISALKVFYTLPSGGKLQVQLSRQVNDRKEFDRPARWATSQWNNAVPQYALTLVTDVAEARYEQPKWKNIKGQFGISWMNQGNVTSGVQPIIPNFRAYTSGAYVIEKWQKGRWTAEAGLRYDWRKQTRFEWASSGVQAEGKTFGNTTFSLGGGYLLNEHLKLQGNFSSAWRAPNMNELYSYGLHGGTASFETGNPLLKAERSYNAELGLVWHNRVWHAEASVYRNRINHFIYKVPLPQPTITIRGAFPNFVFMQDDVLMQGLDATVSRTLGKYFTAGINMGYLHAQNTTDNVPLIFMPANRARFTLGYERDKWWKFQQVYTSVQYQFTAHQHRFPAGIDYVDPPPAYHLVDASLGAETRLGKQILRWSVTVNNLFNVAYRDYLSRFRYYALEPGSNVVVRLIIPF